jgi:hypothetical protein
MKKTAIQQAIGMVKSRIESIDETLMGKHTIHHLQQIERGLYDLLDEEKEQIIDANRGGVDMVVNICFKENFLTGEKYYNENYGDK